jgi:hypothetical protein
MMLFPPSTLSGLPKIFFYGNWIYSTISENLMDMRMQLHNPTACMICVHIDNLFNGNKSSRDVHLECKLHDLAQGEMFANDICHRHWPTLWPIVMH